MKHRKTYNLPASPLSSSSALPLQTRSSNSNLPEARTEFVELLARSNFSFLQGASHPEEMVLRAKQLGYIGLALCDVNGMYGVVRGFQAAERPSVFDAEQLVFADRDGKPKEPFHYMCGSELTPHDASPIVLLPMNKDGYIRLCRLITQAKRPAPKGHISVGLQDILDNNEDLIAFPLPPWNEHHLKRLQAAFQDRVYLPVHRDFTWEAVQVYRHALRLEHALGIQLFATQRPLFHEASRKPLHDVLTCILHKTTLDEAATKLVLNRERHLKPTAEIAALFKERPDLISRTLEIAERVGFSLTELRYKYPQEILPRGKTAAEFLRDLVEEGIKRRYPDAEIPARAVNFNDKFLKREERLKMPFGARVRYQVDYELSTIQKMEYEDYFLTLWDICAYAREKNILHQGRGSAANSVVCFALGLTSVDPVGMGLLFERFISENRGEPPDIDIDFEHERREEVIQYIYTKYGEKRAAMVCTVISYRSRMAVREVAKVLGMPLAKIDQMVKFMGREGLSRLQEANEDFIPRPASSKQTDPILDGIQRERRQPSMIKSGPGPTRVKTQLDQNLGGSSLNSNALDKPRLDLTGLGLSRERFKLLLSLSLEMQGFPRHLGIHSGGFVISHEPIVDIVPVESATMDKRFVIQWNKDDISTLGLMKIDVLSLGMLTAISKAFKLLQTHKNASFDLATIPQDCEPTYKMIQKADTVGVFQIESRAQMSLLPRLKPKNYYDLVIEVAIVRPGPIQGGMVHPYLKRRAGTEKIVYAHEKLKPILSKTLGIPLFQEQVMQIAVEVADFTPGESDELRRVVSSAWKKKAVMHGLYQRVVNGMLNNGISREYAEQIYKTIEGFSSYGFPESHAASFALLTYVSCYLKKHHPDIFTCALLNSQPMGFYSPRQLVADAQRHGVKFNFLDIQESDWDHKMEGSTESATTLLPVRIGFRSVYGLKEDHAQIIVAERERNGRFENLSDLVQRTRGTKNILLRLAAAGAFTRGFDLPVREAMWIIMGMNFDSQSLLFGEPMGLDQELAKTEAREVPPESEWESVHREYRAKGFSIDKHPLGILRPVLTEQARARGFHYKTATDIEKLTRRERVRVAGLLSLFQKPPTAKGICFLSLEDETGLINVVVSKELYQSVRLKIVSHPLLEIEGWLEHREGVRNIKAINISPLQLDNPEGESRIDNSDRSQLRLRSIVMTTSSQ